MHKIQQTHVVAPPRLRSFIMPKITGLKVLSVNLRSKQSQALYTARALPCIDFPLFHLGCVMFAQDRAEVLDGAACSKAELALDNTALCWGRMEECLIKETYWVIALFVLKGAVMLEFMWNRNQPSERDLNIYTGMHTHSRTYHDACGGLEQWEQKERIFRGGEREREWDCWLSELINEKPGWMRDVHGWLAGCCYCCCVRLSLHWQNVKQQQAHRGATAVPAPYRHEHTHTHTHTHTSLSLTFSRSSSLLLIGKGLKE